MRGMPKKKPPSENTRITAAALKLAAQGWSHVTLEAVAKGAKISPATLRALYKKPPDLIPLIAEEIDREAFAPLGNPTGTAHEILFDIIMARFDVMQKHRAAITHIADAARHDPALACALTRAGREGVYRVIDTARINAPPRPALALGIGTVYGWVFLVWRRDASRDMAKAMAALDRSLRWAGKAAEIFKPRF